MNLATKTIRSVDDLKDVVATYERFGEFALDVETRASRKVRMLTLPGDIPPATKGTSRAATRTVVCPSCGREFPPRHGRKWCDDLCRLAAEKDKPALDARTNAVWSISLAGPGRADVIPCGHPDPRQQLEVDDVFAALEPLLFSDRRKIGQNVSFDLLSIAKYYDGAIPPPPYGDTLTLIFLLNENLPSYKLGALSKRYLGLAYADKLGEHAYTTFFEKAVRYSLVDAKMAWMLWWKIHPKLTKATARKLADLFDLEMQVMHVLMNMRQAGAFVDLEEFHHIRPELERQFTEKLAEIREMVGACKCERPRWVERDGINLNSTAQLAHYLYDEAKLRCEFLTEGGARSTSAQALKGLTKRHPVPGMVLEFKDLQKLQSTYISGYIPHIDEDSRIRASLNQTRAKTGRLSCSDPNLQNIPARHKETFEATMVRRLFRAPPGKKLIVADYSQIELRILAHQTKDRLLVYAYTHNLDLHAQTASLIWRIPQDQVTGEQRAIAKNSNFNFAFEGGPGRVEAMSGIPIREAEEVYSAWHRAYPGVKKWGKTVKRFCWEHGYVETLYGRKRRLPEITSDDWKERSYAERQAVNHPIQGTAADIAKIAIVEVHKTLQDFDAALVLQVHDEFVIEVAERQVDEVLPLVRTAMEDIRLGTRPVLDVPLEVNISVGNNWAECK
jgi:DNA polymerase-1